MSKLGNLVWIDLEMTGLNPETDAILEIATIITDGMLTVLEEGPSLVIHQSDAVLEAMGPWVQDLHATSGLTERVRASTVSLEQAERETLACIKKYCTPQMGILCGNSVWQDRNFLVRHMPSITDYLHYRLIDVTSVKQVVAAWYPGNPHLSFVKQDKHRALADIFESIEELRHYRKYFFIST
ncbi:MAG: oligoribonuclease [Candidatus Babeliales bacterium]